MDTYTLTIILDPLTTAERLQLVNAIQTLRGVRQVDTHVIYATRDDPQSRECGYWASLQERFIYERKETPQAKERVRAGHAVAFEQDTRCLIIAHPEPDLMNARFTKIFIHMFQPICPGGSVQFVTEAQ
jgi:hypothetical protein